MRDSFPRVFSALRGVVTEVLKMIAEVRLRNFKCFETLDLPLGPLTLLSGMNRWTRPILEQPGFMPRGLPVTG